jgi:hypothetical protein
LEASTGDVAADVGRMTVFALPSRANMILSLCDIVC